MTQEQLSQTVQSMLQALQAGNTEAARAQAEAILREVPGEPNATQVLAVLYLQRGEADKAIPYLRAAELAAPNHPPILNMLGVAYKQYGRLDEARSIFRRAVMSDASFVDARLNLAQLELDEGHSADAASEFDEVLALQPANVTALVGRARAALLGHDAALARALAERALIQSPAHALATIALASAHLRLGGFAEALQTVSPLLERTDVGPVNRAFAASIAADAENGLGHFDKAFELYGRANELQAEHFTALRDVPGSPFSPANIGRVARMLDAGGLPPAPACPDDEPMPIFLVGFPRSGTTLLEQVLMSHPQIESFGEHSALSNTFADLYAGVDAPARWAALNEGDAAARREKYWQEIAALGAFAPGKVLLDKLPLNSIFLPAIAQVFPRARILFALRDPRDVVLSCFQQRFGMNVAMYQLLGLEPAAHYYDLVMGLAMCTRAARDFTLREVRYEDMVADLEGEARRTIEFLGYPWDPVVLDYRESARARAIDTPSVAQVVEPIYTRSQGKWRKYESHLASVRDVLDQWAKRFGYA